LVTKVREFFGCLGKTFNVFTVGIGDKNAGEDIFKALVTDIISNVEGLTKEIEVLKNKACLVENEKGKLEESELTPCIAKNRLKQAAKDLEHYRSLARSLSKNLSEVLSAAGESGKILRTLAKGPDALIQEIQSGGKADPLAVFLVDVATKSDGKIVALAEASKIVRPQIEKSPEGVGGSEEREAPKPIQGVLFSRPQLAKVK
jgi:hypothetical protein